MDAIKTIQIPDDHKLVAFDMQSLFTNIPLQLALDCTENALKNSTVELPLPTDDIMDLLNPCLTYFKYVAREARVFPTSIARPAWFSLGL